MTTEDMNSINITRCLINDYSWVFLIIDLLLNNKMSNTSIYGVPDVDKMKQ